MPSKSNESPAAAGAAEADGAERRHTWEDQEELRPLSAGSQAASRHVPPREEDPAPAPAGEPVAAGQGYLRRADLLRARFLPEIEVLDFSGLFIGNLGSEVLEGHRPGKGHPADPSYVTDLLLRGNAHRRQGAPAKALLCYQELVELDPTNADFRFLLDATYQVLGTESGS